MKLSKNIVRLYVIILSLLIILYLTVFFQFSTAIREADEFTAISVSKGIKENLDKRISLMKDKTTFYKSMLEEQGEANIEPLEVPKDGFIFKKYMEESIVIINPIKKEIKSIFKDHISHIEKDKDIIEEAYRFLGNKDEDSGIMKLGENVYIISYVKLNVENTYLVIFNKTSTKLLSQISNLKEKDLEIISEIDESSLTQDYVADSITYKIEIEDNYINTYVPIKTINGENIYIRTSYFEQILKVTKIKFLIVAVLVIIVNLFILSFINKKIIKRISKISDSVDNIYNKELPEKKIEVDGEGDEISNLGNRINEMLSRADEANLELIRSERMYKGIINNMANGYICCRIIKKDKFIDGEIVDINAAAIDMFDLENWKGKTIRYLFSNFLNNNMVVSEKVNELLEKPYVYLDKEVLLSKKRWGLITLNKIDEEYFFVIINEITKIKEYSEEMSYIANYDPLTVLYNRRKLLNCMEKLHSKKINYTFFYMDLDDFKGINDTVGHDKGDNVLKSISKKLTALQKENIIISRLGGDEFVVIVQGNLSMEEKMSFGEAILDIIKGEYKFGPYTYEVKASIGIASYPGDGKYVSAIIKYADIAMYNSKVNGGNSISVFNTKMKDSHELNNKIKEAVDKGEFIPYFQPIYNLKLKKVDAFEVLVRWENKSGIIMPGQFLGAAKKSGVIEKIDRKMFEEACKFSAKWKENNGEYISVSVNISNLLLIQKDFTDFILNTIKKYNVPYEYIKIEITEDEIIKDLNYVISILEYLRSVGVKISLDDFGTGYSTYNYINKLPLDIIKLDRSLFTNMLNESKSLYIVKSVIRLCKSLGLEIICEGIEDKEQLQLLKELHCNKIQGYILSKPVPEEETEKFLKLEI